MVGSHQGTGMTQRPPTLLQDRGSGYGDTMHSNHLPGPSFNAHMDVPMAPPGDMQATWSGMFNTLDDPQHPASKNSLPYIFVLGDNLGHNTPPDILLSDVQLGGQLGRN